jgi:hypothetical protein
VALRDSISSSWALTLSLRSNTSGTDSCTCNDDDIIIISRFSSPMIEVASKQQLIYCCLPTTPILVHLI